MLNGLIKFGTLIAISASFVCAALAAPQALGPSGAPVRPGISPAGPSRTQNLGAQGISALLEKWRSAPARVSPTIVNPAARQANAAVVTALRQQKQTALTERNAFAAASTTRVPARVTPQPITTTGGGPANRAAMASQPNVVLACAAFNTPMIQAVSGQEGGKAVFSQDAEFNPFTIKGCNFGNVAGRAQLNYPNGGMMAGLRIDSWTDGLITVEVNPSLVNVLDQNNVTLVVFPPNKPQAQRSGFQFYAMRREMRLASFPQNRKYAQISVTNDDSGQRVAPYLSAPYRGLAYVIAAQAGVSPSQVSPNTDQGWTAGVDRVNAVRFPAGTDIFSFDGLKPGFVLEKFQIDEQELVVCHAGALFYIGSVLEGGLPVVGPSTLKNMASSQGVTNYTDGTWNATIDQNAIRVNWAEGHCHATDGNDSSNSSYALSVWVLGPALSPGASPWQ